MGGLFVIGMLLYFMFSFGGRRSGGAELAKLLWWVYLGLGLSATFIGLTDVLRPVFAPNYASTLFLLLCICLCISGFQRFRADHLTSVVGSFRSQTLIENFLIALQFGAIVFFLPFAVSSLTGDANENRLELASKAELLGSYGLLNTAAGAASQLFSSSLVMAFIRLSQPVLRRGSYGRAMLLMLASLSYVIYILAYVGRDGIVYWLMTILMVFLVFKPHLPARARGFVLMFGSGVLAIMLIPFAAITVARFSGTDHGSVWSILDYFGTQIQTFSDYSTLDRPLTLGAMNFPKLVGSACYVAGFDCPSWDDIRWIIFDQYLDQGKEPWLFGTFVSDFVGDFGYWGTLLLIAVFSALSHRLCSKSAKGQSMTLPRLLLILFMFLVPYWGVFFFRFSIVNGYIVVNLAFILIVKVLLKFRVSMATRNQHPRSVNIKTS